MKVAGVRLNYDRVQQLRARAFLGGRAEHRVENVTYQNLKSPTSLSRTTSGSNSFRACGGGCAQADFTDATAFSTSEHVCSRLLLFNYISLHQGTRELMNSV
jgi:hypothetical protein